MTDHNNQQFDDLVDRLLENRSSLEPVDLDRIKLQVLGRGSSQTFVAGGNRSRVLAPILAVGLMGGGTAGVLAGGGGGGSNKPPATCTQYKSNGKPKTAKSCNKPKACKTHKNGNQTPTGCTPKTQKPPSHNH